MMQALIFRHLIDPYAYDCGSQQRLVTPAYWITAGVHNVTKFVTMLCHGLYIDHIWQRYIPVIPQHMFAQWYVSHHAAEDKPRCSFRRMERSLLPALRLEKAGLYLDQVVHRQCNEQ